MKNAMYCIKTLFFGAALTITMYSISPDYLSFTEKVLSFIIGSLAYMQVSDEPKKKAKKEKVNADIK
jgi:hypothetical protein